MNIASYKLDVSDSSTMFISLVASITLISQNPNIVGIKYDFSRLNILNNGLVVGMIRIPEFYQPARSHNISIQIDILFQHTDIGAIVSGAKTSSFPIRVSGDIGTNIWVLGFELLKIKNDTRGCPIFKTQQQRGNESTQSAVVDSQESSFQLTRHSSFTPAMSNQQRPALQRSRSTSCRVKKGLETSQVDSVVASPVKPQGMNNLRRFGGYIPSMLHCYVSNIQDVMPDYMSSSDEMEVVGDDMGKPHVDDLVVEHFDELMDHPWLQFP
ncbi:hypothetical protein R6Q57_020714 [Mikania cordata]